MGLGLGRVVGLGVGLGQGHIEHIERHGSMTSLFVGPIGDTEIGAAGAPPSGILHRLFVAKSGRYCLLRVVASRVFVPFEIL